LLLGLVCFVAISAIFFFESYYGAFFTIFFSLLFLYLKSQFKHYCHWWNNCKFLRWYFIISLVHGLLWAGVRFLFWDDVVKIALFVFFLLSILFVILIRGCNGKM